MALAMASFSVTDAISKFLTLQMNFVAVMLLGGLFAGVLIGLLVLHRRAFRPLRVVFVAPVVTRMGGGIGGAASFFLLHRADDSASCTRRARIIIALVLAGLVLVAIVKTVLTLGAR